MPEDRGKLKKRAKVQYPLQKKVVKATLVGAVVIGLIMFVIGLGLYSYSLASRYIGMTCELAGSSAAILGTRFDIEKISNRIREKYYSLTEEERQKTGTQEYRDWFSFVEEEEDYPELRYTIFELEESSDVNFLYLAFIDEKNQALVYVCDPDISDETGCFPGEWETIPKREADKFIAKETRNRVYDIGYTRRYGWMCTGVESVYNEKGDIVCQVMADVTLSNFARAIRLFVLQYAVAFAAVVLILSRVMARRMGRMVVDPVNRIAEAARNYKRDHDFGRKAEAHFSNLDIHTGDEVENLSLVMADMERSMENYEENLTRITAEKERISTELGLATRIQASMLPDSWPAFPDRREFDIYAVMDPAREVGGDFYDFFWVDEDHLAFLIADVSGKGIPAALFMMAAKIILANNAMMGKSPAQILESTNTSFCANNREEMFVTVWLGILEISTGKLKAANAGHEYPVFLKPDGQFELIRDRHGFVIGGMSGMKYTEYELQIEPGGGLFLYTDGIPEATNGKNELFGTDRMMEALNQERGGTPEEVINRIKDAVDRFVGDAEQFDDLTMLCFKYFGNGQQE